MQNRSLPRAETSARKPWTTNETTYEAGDGECEIAYTKDIRNGSTPSSYHSGYSSRRQILEDMNQLDAVTRAAQSEASSPQPDIQSNRSPRFPGEKRSVNEYMPATLGVSSQKISLQQRDSTVETSSEGSSASEINTKESTASTGSSCCKRTFIAVLILLLLASAGGAVYYFTVYSASEENSANLVVPAPSPKQSEGQAENPPVAPLVPKASIGPTVFPTFKPSIEPGATTGGASKPPVQTTLSPTALKSSSPSLLATQAPTLPTQSEPIYPKIELGGSDKVTTFYAIGDVPYSTKQAEEILVQIRNIPSDAEFVIHVGDIRNYDSANPLCLEEEYDLAADLFKESPVPVFMIIGDNEWIDCSNKEEGYGWWKERFIGFESRYWNHTFDIVHQPGRSYNFAFVNKETLFIGLNIVGLPVHDALEWETRLTEEVEWAKALIRNYSSTIGETGRVVIFGHANPSSAHYYFFSPLDAFLSTEMNNQLPVLYLNGDKHEWSYDPSFQGVESLLRIMVTGGSSEPPLQMKIVANGQPASLGQAFLHDRKM